MNKRKQTHDYSTGHGSGAVVTPKPSKKSKRLTRHMYTNEQQRFIWYYRDILKMSAKEVHKSFYEYFSTDVAVSVDGLNQLAGRLRRIQSPEVVSAKNTEIWAIPSLPDQPSQIITTNDLLDGFRSSGSAKSRQDEPRKDESEKDRSELGESEKDRSKLEESRRGEPEQEESGQDERRIIADGHQLPPSPGPADPPSSPRRRHPRRHMYTIEEHRFVWFHRFHLMMKSSQTHEMFQKTFHIPSVKKDHLNQLAARLWRHNDPKVTAITHSEPWAVRVVSPGTVTPGLKDAEGKASGTDIEHKGCTSWATKVGSST